MDNDEEQVHHRRGASEPDVEPSTHEDAHDPSIVSTESLQVFLTPYFTTLC